MAVGIPNRATVAREATNMMPITSVVESVIVTPFYLVVYRIIVSFSI